MVSTRNQSKMAKANASKMKRYHLQKKLKNMKTVKVMVSTRNESKMAKANASKMKKYHLQKKLKNMKAVKVSEVLQLYDSSVQDSKCGTRLGSTLVMATAGSFMKIGNALKLFMGKQTLK